MEWNNKPHDDFSPNPSRKKPRQYAKDEFIQDISHATKNADIVARRSERKHQRLNGDVAEEVVEKGPVLSVGEFEYKEAWYSIVEDAVAKWLAGNEIRNVSKPSLAGLLRHGAWMSEAEREKTEAQPEVPGAYALLHMREQEDDQNAAPSTTPASAATTMPKRKSAAAPRKKKRESPDDEYVQRKGRSQRPQTQRGDIPEDGSDIEVKLPSHKQAQPSRRRQQPVEYLQGLTEASSTSMQAEEMGESRWPGTGWYVIFADHPPPGFTDKPVCKVPAQHSTTVGSALSRMAVNKTNLAHVTSPPD